MRHLLTAILATGCLVPSGQQVSATFSEDTLPCVEVDGARVATLPLTREDDLYLAELVQRSTGKSFVADSVREGSTVVFTCPQGLEELTIRHVSITEPVVASTTPTPTPSDGRTPP